MGARDALKNYRDDMVKRYGLDFTERWTQDDRETFEILARRASKHIRNVLIRQTDNTPFLLRLRGTK